MPTHYDDDEDLPTSGDREISLGTGTVLAIFLALALVCSLFFGLGYSMGRKSAPNLAAASASPAATSLRGSSSDSSDDTPPANQVVQPTESNRAPVAAVPANSTQVREHMATPKPSPVADLPPAPTAVPLNPASQTWVQVAAVSRKEDADLLLTALKHRGYSAAIRPQTQDKLLHIQVGPFPTKKDAEAMRQHLITDGYNPILK